MVPNARARAAKTKQLKIWISVEDKAKVKELARLAGGATLDEFVHARLFGSPLSADLDPALSAGLSAVSALAKKCTCTVGDAIRKRISDAMATFAERV